MEETPTERFMAQMVSDFKEFRSALTQETDRGCALYAAAYLDKALSDLLLLSLVENKNIGKDLFEGTAPLASFSARITLAYYLGKISKSMRRDLDLIRKIRNEFAHSALNLSFDSQKVAGRCKALQYTYHVAGQRPRAHFTAAVSGILSSIQMTGLRTVAPAECVDKVPTEKEKASLREKVGKLVQDLVNKPHPKDHLNTNTQNPKDA